MATRKEKHVHSFSTNFFGVVGYICSSFVWLLVLMCLAISLPASDTSDAIYILSTEATSSQPVDAPLALLLSVLLAVVFWAFSYVAARILSRIVRRIAKLTSRTVSIGVLIKTKYYILAIGLVAFAVLLLFVPAYDWFRAAAALLGLLAGIGGVIAIWLQYHLAKRHRVPVVRLL